jgi:protein involved in polysaccharide export with SLBB domain
VVGSLLCGCAALTNPVADGVSVRHLPPELLEPSKEGEQTIPLTMLGRPMPATYRLEPGDVLGVYVEGFLGEKDQTTPLPVHIGSQVLIRDQHRLPVEDDGTIHIPSANSLLVKGMSIAEAREAIRALCIQKRVFKQENARALVTLLSPRQYQVLVLRQEAASFSSSTEGPILSSKRGTGHFIDLAANENDVLHALAQTGGLPGLDARNEIVIERNCFHGDCDRQALL